MAIKKPTRKRSTSTRKKSTTRRTRKSSKTTEKKKAEVIHPRERNEIKLSSHVYNMLLTKTNHTVAGYARAFLIGEDDKQIARMILPLARDGYGGCGQMPDINRKSLINAYVKMAKKGFIPIGMARTGGDFGNGAHWNGDAGPALYAEIGYMVSVDKGNIVAQVFLPKKKGKRSRHERGYYDGDIKTLTVLLTDK